MSFAVKLSLGPRGPFAARVFALSALVALVTASFALRDVISGAAPAAGGGGAQLLVASFLAGVGSLIDAWLVPVWVLTAAGAFVVAFDSSRAFAGTSFLLSDLGGERRTRSAAAATRGAVLAGASFVIGVSVGVVVSQVVFRAVLVLLGAPYYVPELSPVSLGLTALISLSALVVGAAAATAADLRRGWG